MKNYKELIEKYYVGETSLEEEEKIAEWLFSGEAPEEYNSLRTQFSYFESFKEIKQKPVRNLRWVSVAAVILLGVFVSLLIPVEPENIIVASGQHVKRVELPDGSIVHLNKNSVLSYLDNFNEDARLINITGEGFFDVAKDKERPFIVSFGNSSVKVLGTKFNINTNNNAEHLFVKEGKVQLQSENIMNEKVIVTTGEEIEAVKGKKTDKPPMFSSNLNITSWITKKLVFKKTPLFEAIKQIEKHYNTKIEIELDASEEMLLSGVFHNTNEKDLLGSVCEIFSLNYAEKNNKYLIY